MLLKFNKTKNSQQSCYLEYLSTTNKQSMGCLQSCISSRIKKGLTPSHIFCFLKNTNHFFNGSTSIDI